MASPQPDKYTKISNELLEAFSRLNASGSAWRIFMVVLRKTYGYHKKVDKISLTQFEKMSGLSRKSVCRGLNELIELKIITVEKEGYINKYQVQKDYELWGSVKPVTSDKNDTKSSVKPVTKTSDKNDTYKRKKERKIFGEAKASAKLPPLLDNKEDMSWNKQSDDYEEGVVDLDGDGSLAEEKKAPTRKYPNAPAVRKIFQEVLGRDPSNWRINKNQLTSCENLVKERGLDRIKRALEFYKEHEEEEYCPKIHSPFDLDSKWTKLGEYKLSL